MSELQTQTQELENVFTIEDALAFQEEGTFTLPFTLKLTKEITVAGVLHKTVTVRREPTIQDLEDLPVLGQKMKDFKKAVSRTTGEPSSVVNALSFKDFNNILGVLQPFMS